MLLIFLFLLLIALCVFVVKFFKHDYLSPAVCALFSFCVVCFGAMTQISNWNIIYSPLAFAYIFFGVVVYILFSIFGQKLALRQASSVLNEANVKEQESQPLTNISIDWRIVALVTVICVVISAFYIGKILQIATYDGFHGSWNAVMQHYRDITNYKLRTMSKAQRMPTLLSYSYLIVQAAAYVFIFFFIHNVVAVVSNSHMQKSLKEKLMRMRLDYLVPVIIFCVGSLAQATRGQLVYLAIAACVYLWVDIQRVHNWTYRPTRKVVLGVMGLLVCLVLVFFALGSLVGRASMLTNLGRLLPIYCGGSLQAFNLFVTQGFDLNTLFGQESFQAIWSFIGRRLNDPKLQFSPQLPFIASNGHNVGNIYTAFRPYLHDFGIVGMLFIVALQAFILTFIYVRVSRKISTETNYGLLIYGMLAFSPFYLPLMDTFCQMFIAPRFIISVAVVCILAWSILQINKLVRRSLQHEH